MIKKRIAKIIISIGFTKITLLVHVILLRIFVCSLKVHLHTIIINRTPVGDIYHTSNTPFYLTFFTLDSIYNYIMSSTIIIKQLLIYIINHTDIFFI